MPSLEQVLASVPGLAGYQATVNQNNQRGMQTLQMAQGAGGILAQIAAQAKAQREAGREAEYRAEIAGAETPEARLSVASKYMGPEALGKMIQTSQDVKTRTDATKEATLARLKQSADQFEQNYQIRLKQATTAEERLNLDRQYRQVKLAMDNAALQQTGQRLFYDTGMQPAAAPAVPTLAPSQPATVTAVPTMQGQAPNEAAAVAAINAGGGKPMSLEIPKPATTPAPALVPAPAAAADGTKPLSIADAPAGLSPKKKQEWLLQQSKPSIAGGGLLTPEALTFTAKQYLAGDRQAAQGYARNATARIALQNAIVDEAMKQGMSPKSVAAQMAEYAGAVAGSRTIGQRAANISLAATEAQEMLGIVKETSDQFKRTSFIPFNMALKAYETNTGSPEITNFGASLNALVNVYARAINPTGVPTVSDKEHARAVINSVQSPEQVDGVLNIIRRELEIAKKAPGTVREATRQSITGGEPDRRTEQRAAPSKRVVVDY